MKSKKKAILIIVPLVVILASVAIGATLMNGKKDKDKKKEDKMN